MSGAVTGTNHGGPPATWRELSSPLYWQDGAVVLLDQRRLPLEELWIPCRDEHAVAEAIRAMVVRGAPAIGCAAAFGLAAGATQWPDDTAQFAAAFARAAEHLAQARPTAVNLHWAIDCQRSVVDRTLGLGVPAVRRALVSEGLRIWQEDIAACQTIGRLGAALIADGARILTHCNAGALATGGYGTALGVIRGARAAGKRIQVFVDETRPYLQGARLTAWELQRDGFDVTLICDNMAGSLMRQGEISCCIVGADRIARNGDVANKVGTYPLAVLAQYHRLPFFVAAPCSTLDVATATGADIPIEERDAAEVTHVGGVQIAPAGVNVRYPAFDVTPAALVTAIVTEHGVAQPPAEAALVALARAAAAGRP